MAGKAGTATGMIIAHGATHVTGMRVGAIAEATFTRTAAAEIVAGRHSVAAVSSTVAEVSAAKAASMAADAGTW
jgi:hypothetical protein